MNTSTKRICNRELTLVPGRRYLAARPMASREGQLFPVFIHDISDQSPREYVEVLECFSYDEANEFLAAFNYGPSSFDGRVW